MKGNNNDLQAKILRASGAIVDMGVILGDFLEAWDGVAAQGVVARGVLE